MNSSPIFMSVFGRNWHDLPPIMQKHYANRPYTSDETTVHGTLDVLCRPPLIWFAPIMKGMGQIPARNESGVPVTVLFKSDTKTPAVHFIRMFHFAQGESFRFHSRMVHIKDNEVIELMRFGLCWKMLYRWDGTKVILEHNGYAVRLFGRFIPIPLTLLMGKGYAEEIAVDDYTFDMMTHITHPWWGKVYEYKGRFTVKK